MQKILKTTLSAAASTAVALLLFSGCSEKKENPSPTGNKQVSGQKNTFYLIPKTGSSEYWRALIDGAQSAAADLNVKLVVKSPDSESDTAEQIAILNQAVSQNPAAIVIAPSNALKLAPPIEMATNKKVPVIVIDSKAATNKFVSFLASDNAAIGVLAADKLAEAVKADKGKVEGKILCITYLSGGASLDKRIKGFTERINTRYSGLKIVETSNAGGKPGKAAELLREALKKYKDLTGIFANNQVTGGEVVAELEKENRKNLAIVVVDSGKKEIEGIKNGFVDAMIVQKPWMMGYMGVDCAVKASKGEKLDKYIDTGIAAITPDMIKDGSADEFLSPIEFNNQKDK